MNEQERFYQLLTYANELKKTNKSLLNENSKVFNMLLTFLVKIENNLHYSEKKITLN